MPVPRHPDSLSSGDCARDPTDGVTATITAPSGERWPRPRSVQRQRGHVLRRRHGGHRHSRVRSDVVRRPTAQAHDTPHGESCVESNSRPHQNADESHARASVCENRASTAVIQQHRRDQPAPGATRSIIACQPAGAAQRAAAQRRRCGPRSTRPAHRAIPRATTLRQATVTTARSFRPPSRLTRSQPAAFAWRSAVSSSMSSVRANTNSGC